MDGTPTGMTYEHIDAGGMATLTRELQNDVAASLRFVDDFLAAWPERRERVLRGPGSMIIDDCLVALLTLTTSSAMIGAHTLSAAARELYSESRAQGGVSAHGAERVARLGEVACLELRNASELYRSGVAV